jgi:hypothetical protein
MITESTTTEDLIVTFSNARGFNTMSFEQGCDVLDAIEMFNSRTASGKLSTWQEYSSKARNALLVPVTDDLHAHRLVCDKLAQDVVAWTCHQLDCSALAVGALFTAWVVIDRATRVAWIECSPVKDQRAQHPRAIREAGEFPSSSRGTVDAHAFLRMGETWHEVLDSVLEAYHEAKHSLDRKIA